MSQPEPETTYEEDSRTAAKQLTDENWSSFAVAMIDDTGYVRTGVHMQPNPTGYSTKALLLSGLVRQFANAHGVDYSRAAALLYDEILDLEDAV